MQSYHPMRNFGCLFINFATTIPAIFAPSDSPRAGKRVGTHRYLAELCTAACGFLRSTSILKNSKIYWLIEGGVD